MKEILNKPKVVWHFCSQLLILSYPFHHENDKLLSTYQTSNCNNQCQM